MYAALQSQTTVPDFSKSEQLPPICFARHLNPLTAKLFNWNFHPLEAVSR